MIDLGIDKLALIGAVALIVIGPERLPRVARMLGHFIGKAQRYVADVKAEVNRSMELEELHKMKSQMDEAARNVQQTVASDLQQVSSGLDDAWAQTIQPPSSHDDYHGDPAGHHRPRKNWRLKRSAVPQWYKQRAGVRSKVQSGAARVARFRPVRPRSP